ncbi:hypothetical protein KP509_23G084700 [Ceratopteris richardii]|uniref:Pentatricopeptide repeat-containing protein n=2 Tax=Ceratopteris richardii TaxID=49495 RepID=A0A8T2S4G0_CERRI|nr:hypothetical protein KP509_23G084700 [Ceratopteris richardii]
MESLTRLRKAWFCSRFVCFSCGAATNPGFERLVDTVCTLINREEQWNRSLEDAILSAAPNFHARLLFRILKLQSNPDMASQLFHWASRMPNFTHTPFTYCALIEVLARCKDFDQIWHLIHSMHVSKIGLSQFPFTILINAYGNAGLIEDAQRTFNAMVSYGCKPNVCVYNALLNAQMKAGRTDDALNTFKSMDHIGCTPDVVTYTSMITGLSNAGDTDKMIHLMEQMDQTECTPNTWTFTAIIQGLLKAGKETEALSMHDKMLESGCSPDIVTYNSFLEWFFSKGNCDKALEMVEQMAMKGCVPDASTYGILVTGLFKADRAEIAVDFVRRMVINRFHLDVSVYNTLTLWLCKDPMSDRAVRVFSCILSMNCSNQTINYNIVIDELLKAEQVDLVLRTVTELLSNGICPDKAICTPLINCLCKEGRTEEAVKILEKVTDSEASEGVAYDCLSEYIV